MRTDLSRGNDRYLCLIRWLAWLHCLAVDRYDRIMNTDNWPFKYFNGVQTPDSEALQANKQAHKPTKQPINLNQFKEALL